MSCYFYDAVGERTVKLTSETEMVHVNGKKVGGNDNVCKFTAYVSPYFVVSNGGAYTKHIYAASQRIASKLGNEDGFGADPRRVEMAGGKKISDIQKDNIGARFSELGFSYTAPEKEKVEKDSTMDSEEPENLVFFYHPDHLGSTSYVTDADGNIAQHIEYIPYGEVFVEERNHSFSTNFLFNAKELDNETGLYYYGARYLDPTGAMWLSVDPLFEKYAGMSPYNYCAGNPVKLVDPDGRENTVFLVDLQTEKKLDVQKLIENVNQALENFGLETRMVMAPGGKDFDPQYMDGTDSYVAIGNITDVYNFIEEKSPEDFKRDFKDAWGCVWGPNPEKTSMIHGRLLGSLGDKNATFDYGIKTSVIGIALGAAIKTANECGISILDYFTYLTCHSLGHNAGISHPNDNVGYSHKNCPYHWDNTMIMNSGTKFSDELSTSSDKMSTYNKFMDPRNNSGFIKGMTMYFGNKKSRNNYEFNRKYPNLSFGKKK